MIEKELSEILYIIKENLELLYEIRTIDEFKDNWGMAIGLANLELGYKQFMMCFSEKENEENMCFSTKHYSHMNPIKVCQENQRNKL